MKVAVVGSRGYPDLEHVRAFVRRLSPLDVVVSGGAPGVDQVAAREARERGLDVEVFPADWSRHGRAAGPIRNAQIVAACDRVAAFWDGKSSGTLDTIRKAVAAGKLTTVKRPGQSWRALGAGEVVR